VATTAVQWHLRRRARILAKHPEIRALQGPYPLSQVVILLLVAVDIALACALRSSAWIIVVALAVSAGATLAHALGVLIHECTHNLVARGARANKLWMLVANVPLLAPAAVGFRAQHLLHHRFLGEVDGRDTQAPTRAEIAFTGGSAIRKLASFTFGRFFYPARPANHVPVDRFLVLNWAIQAVACAALLWFAGPRGFSFLLLSGLLAYGPHPLGARRLSEHFAERADQPTVSYYGPANVLSLDVGYHVEHHDFPAVPWPSLRTLRRIASEEYDRLFAFHSWSRLLVAHVFDRRYRVEHYFGFGAALEGGLTEGPDTGPADSTVVARPSTPGNEAPDAPGNRAPIRGREPPPWHEPRV
jgi:sphingolipid delta-4 desaturase